METRIGRQYITSRQELGIARFETLQHLFENHSKSSTTENKVGFASLYVTGRCHLSCPHCYAEEEFAGLSKDASTEQMVKIINFLCQLTSRIQLTGGEIFVRADPESRRNDTLLLVDEISQRNREVIMQTTGMHITVPMLKFCAVRNVKWFSLSLDGPDAESNSLIRGNNSAFTKTIELIPQLKRFGFKVKVGTTMTALTQKRENLIKIGELMEKLGVDNWKITQFFGREKGRASGENAHWLSVPDELFYSLTTELQNMFQGKEMRVTTHSVNDFSSSPALLVQPTGIITVTHGADDVYVGNALTDKPTDTIARLESMSGITSIKINAQKTY